MTEDPRPVRIGTLLAFDGEWLTFSAEDRTGPLLVRVDLGTWERLQADAPVLSDVADRRDFALGMMETEAADIVAAPTPAGRMVIVQSHDA